MKSTLAAIVVAAAALSVPGPRPAEACGNPIVFATDATVRAVKQADDLLNEGSPTEAGTLIQKTIKELAHGYPSPRTNDKKVLLVNRGLRILALASVRLDGEYGTSNKSTAEGRQANVKWAIGILKELKELKGDPASKTDYAEALSRTSAAEARTMLDELAQKDLVTSPYGYAALASLRAAAGDGKGRDEALAKCNTMAAKKAICEIAKPKPNG